MTIPLNFDELVTMFHHQLDRLSEHSLRDEWAAAVVEDPRGNLECRGKLPLSPQANSLVRTIASVLHTLTKSE